MDEKTELLVRENKIVSAMSRLYILFNKLVHSDDDVNQVLYALYMEGGQTQKQISVNYCVPPQTVNNIVLSMQKKGIVTLRENPKDRRSKIVEFTGYGFEFAEKQIGALISIEKKAINRMGFENYKKMLELQELAYFSLKEELLASFPDEKTTKTGRPGKSGKSGRDGDSSAQPKAESAIF